MFVDVGELFEVVGRFDNWQQVEEGFFQRWRWNMWAQSAGLALGGR